MTTRSLILIGFQSCGKTSIGQRFAAQTHRRFLDTDRLLEAAYAQKTGQNLSCSDIYHALGSEAFRSLEHSLLTNLPKGADTVIATVGGIILLPHNLSLLRAIGHIVYLSLSYATLLARLQARTLPAYMPNTATQDFPNVYRQREPLYRQFADSIL